MNSPEILQTLFDAQYKLWNINLHYGPVPLYILLLFNHPLRHNWKIIHQFIIQCIHLLLWNTWKCCKYFAEFVRFLERAETGCPLILLQATVDCKHLTTPFGKKFIDLYFHIYSGCFFVDIFLWYFIIYPKLLSYIFRCCLVNFVLEDRSWKYDGYSLILFIFHGKWQKYQIFS